MSKKRKVWGECGEAEFRAAKKGGKNKTRIVKAEDADGVTVQRFEVERFRYRDRVIG